MKTRTQSRPLTDEQLLKLEKIRLAILAAHPRNPDVPSHIAQRWHINLQHGGDGVKWVLKYLSNPEVTPPAIMDEIPVNRGMSANRQERGDGHKAKREALKRLGKFVQQMWPQG